MKRVQMDGFDEQVSEFGCDVGSPLLGARSESITNWGVFDPICLPKLLSIPEKGVFEINRPEEDFPQYLTLCKGSEIDEMDDVEENIKSPLSLAARSSSQPLSNTSAQSNGKEFFPSEPPVVALEHENPVKDSNAFFTITQQPPREVRTRKKKEKRPFTVKLEVKQLPNQPIQGKGAVLTTKLVFADSLTPVNQESDCSLRIPISEANRPVTLDGLGICNPCVKFDDREFALCIEFLGAPESRIYSQPIYSYSNLGVLQRRRKVSIVGLSLTRAGIQGGQRMHVVGKPFFKSDRLKAVFRVFNRKSQRWVTLDAPNLEVYSESVLFFDTPKVPMQLIADTMTPSGNVHAFVQVTNDRESFSNGLEFTFSSLKSTSNVISGPACKLQAKRCRSEDDFQQARL